MTKILFLLFACAAAMAQAQPVGKLPRIGILSPSGDAATRAQLGIFTDRLRELGYEEGRNLQIERRMADGKFDRLQQFAGELVKAGVDVIVTQGTPAVAAARRATATIPIVAASIDDPVASGFARSLAKPGGNITGFATMGSLVHEKRLELLLEAVPDATKVGLLVHADDNFFRRILPGLEAAAKKLGREIVLVNVRNEKELQGAFANLVSRRVGAVVISDDYFLNALSPAVAGLALKHKLPAIFPTLRGAEEGGLIGYASDPKFRYQSTANYVDKILKGARPAEMPIEPPMKFTLVVNKKTAAALGIAIPASILARADRVIE